MRKLIFVYNANSGLFNGLFDYAHKIVSPETYACSLCAITYDNLGMKTEWKEFIKNLPIACDFIYKDQLSEKYKIEDIALPAVFRLEGEHLEQIVNADRINNCKSLKELEELIVAVAKQKQY